LRPDVPESVAAVLERLMAKEPALRYASAAEAANALALTDPVPRRRAWRIASLVAASLILVGVAVAVLQPNRPAAEIPPATPNPETVAETSPTDDKAKARPAGGFIAVEKRKVADQMIGWLRDHNRWRPDHPIVADTSEPIERGLEKGDGFVLLFGGKVVKSNQPTVVIGRLGVFGVYELTPRQARAAKIGDTRGITRRLTSGGDLRVFPPRVELSDLRFDAPDDVDPSRPVTGTVVCKFSEPTPPDSFLRLTYYPPDGGRIAIKDYPKQSYLAGEATVRFTNNGLEVRKFRDEKLVVLFAEWCVRDGTADRVESNAVTALVTLKE
jgi:hypothetical protein